MILPGKTLGQEISGDDGIPAKTQNTALKHKPKDWECNNLVEPIFKLKQKLALDLFLDLSSPKLKQQPAVGDL